MTVLAVVAGIILLAAACSGSSSSSPDTSSSPGTSNAAKAVAYANCMRQHGVDVNVGSNGNISAGGGAGGAGAAGQQATQSAQDACRHLLPNGGQPPQAKQAQALAQALKYTRCMRSHGVPDFPDPSQNNGGPIGFNGVNAGTPAYTKANQACQSLLAGGGS